MRKHLFAALFLVFCPIFLAQQASAQALIVLKTEGASDKVLAAIVLNSAGPGQVAPAPAHPPQSKAVTPELPTVSCNPQPTIQMSLSEFHLDGTGATQNSAFGGLIPSLIAHSHNRPYFDSITSEVKYVYQKAIQESCQFQYVNNEKPGGAAAQNPPSVSVNAKPFWVTEVGMMHWRPAIFTRWEVDGPGGCKLKIKTKAVSKEKVRGIPNGADPKSKHFYLELSKQDAGLFLDELEKEIK